jgi:hypothetical protein
MSCILKSLDKSVYLLFNDITPPIDMSKMTAFSIVQCRSKINVNVFVQAMLSMYHLCYIRLPFALLKLLSVYCRPNIDRLEIQYNVPTTNTIHKELQMHFIARLLI